MSILWRSSVGKADFQLGRRRPAETPSQICSAHRSRLHRWPRAVRSWFDRPDVYARVSGRSVKSLPPVSRRARSWSSRSASEARCPRSPAIVSIVSLDAPRGNRARAAISSLASADRVAQSSSKQNRNNWLSCSSKLSITASGSRPAPISARLQAIASGMPPQARRSASPCAGGKPSKLSRSIWHASLRDQDPSSGLTKIDFPKSIRVVLVARTRVG